MRVVSEVLTVLHDGERSEVNVLMAGLRITLSQQEAALLSRELAQALSRISAAERIETAAAFAAPSAPPPPAPLAVPLRAAAPTSAAERPELAERDAALLDRVEAIRRRAAVNIAAARDGVPAS